jgi:hypothetical protein
MPVWRIRITMSDDPRSYALLTAALAEQRVRALQLSPRGAELAGHVVLELPSDEGFGALLGELHKISPHVFVSRADPSPRHAMPIGLQNGALVTPGA